jgi:protein-tyrosine phosphatase
VIDLHSHILPDLDDGARTLAASLEIARACVADGVDLIAATPHVRHDYPTRPDVMEEGVALLQMGLNEEGIELAVLGGGEISFDYLRRLTADDRRRFGLGGNPSYLLLEFPYYGWTMALEHHVKALVADGITPVVAHPERNTDVQHDPKRVATLVESGALIQLTAAAIDGRIGRSAPASARQGCRRPWRLWATPLSVAGLQSPFPEQSLAMRRFRRIRPRRSSRIALRGTDEHSLRTLRVRHADQTRPPPTASPSGKRPS